jgi:hypothetical protein
MISSKQPSSRFSALAKTPFLFQVVVLYAIASIIWVDDLIFGER